MKKLSSRDWAIAGIIGGIFLIIGLAIGGIYKKPTIVSVENPLNIHLKKSCDSLESLVYYRDSLIKINEKRQVVCDSMIITNNRQLKKEYEKIKNFTPEFRAHFVDSILRAAQVRR